MTARTAPARLTDLDRELIADARALAAATGKEALLRNLAATGLAKPGELSDRDLYPFAFGVARSMLGLLADLAERLGGTDG